MCEQLDTKSQHGSAREKLKLPLVHIGATLKLMFHV